MAHSWLIDEPSGAPLSKKARRNQAPSQPAACSAAIHPWRASSHRFAPFALARGEGARQGEGGEALDHAAEEPGQPDRLAAAFVADPVHAVVPVAGAHQRQAVYAGRQALVDGAGAVLVHARALLAGARGVVGILGAVGDPGTDEEGHPLVEHRAVRADLHVVGRGIGQPEQVVREMRAHPGAARHVPPVLDVALGELARRIDEDLLAQARRNQAPSQPAACSAVIHPCRAASQRLARSPSPRASAKGAKRSTALHRNQASQTDSPRPSWPTRFMPSFQSPVPISGRPCRPVARLLSIARAPCS